jgi:hypothetical protein
LRQEFPADVNDFVALREAGFTFYFVPHGRELGLVSSRPPSHPT